MAAAFDAVEAELGLPSVLVNNAAGNFPVPAEDLSPNGWRTVVEIVLNGTFYCSREFGRRHIAAGTPGSIVNIGASYAWTGGPGFAHSAAAKAGVKNLTETLAVEWAPYGIRVNCLVPGLFPHQDEAADIRGVPERGQSEDARSPAGRVGRPRELGWAATFLASPYAAYVSGATLAVDGANWQRRAMLMPEFRRSASSSARGRSAELRIRMQEGSQAQPAAAGLRDPVCGMTVSPATAAGSLHPSRTYVLLLQRALVPGALPRRTRPPSWSRPGAAPRPAGPSPAATPVRCIPRSAAMVPAPAHLRHGPRAGRGRSTARTNPELERHERRFWCCAALTAPLVALAMRSMLPGHPLEHACSRGRSLGRARCSPRPVVLWGGWPFFVRGLALAANRSLNMFTLIGLGWASPTPTAWSPRSRPTSSRFVP